MASKALHDTIKQPESAIDEKTTLIQKLFEDEKLQMDLNAGEDMTKLRQILSGKGWGHIDWTAFSEDNQDFTYDVVEDI